LLFFSNKIFISKKKKTLSIINLIATYKYFSPLNYNNYFNIYVINPRTFMALNRWYYALPIFCNTKSIDSMIVDKFRIYLLSSSPSSVSCFELGFPVITCTENTKKFSQNY